MPGQSLVQTDMSFQEIPIIDLSRAFDPKTKPTFLKELRHALINVGFLLLKGYEPYGPSREDLDNISRTSTEFFNLPDHVKLEIEMVNSPHFLGYTRLANEITAKKTDWREQIDLGTELPAPKEGDPIYKNIEGPNLWPDSKYAGDFRPIIEDYIQKMQKLSATFRKLVCEAIGLPENALDSYFQPNQQAKMKLIAYPDVLELSNKTSVAIPEDSTESNQGVGPHRDSDLMTFIYQVTGHQNSLQVQNFQGKWVTVENIPDTLVVNAGQTLEAITQGVCKATIHKVLIPEAGTGTRISVPFFQTIDLDSNKAAVDNIPQEIIDLKNARDEKIEDWGVDVGFQFIPDISKHPVGYTVFRNRVKSHQDVAARWYPDILKEVLNEF